MTRYFEIYVPGRNGYSLYVATSFPLSNSRLDDQILGLAIRASVISRDDALDAQYVLEHSLVELAEAGIDPQQLATI
jgi:hypothetical protein